ncbi:MAG TPA: hypothetical protein VFL95_10030 [Gemmatimonadales bacterium]|nr:hypothetical protein [Gemmatimonadales bacterium]
MPHTSLRRFAALAGLGTLLVTGCQDRPKQPKLPPLNQVFSELLLPPQAKLVARSGGPDAIQLTFQSKASPDFLAAYYRDALTRKPWTLVSDVQDSTGAIILYAEQPGPPMWVRIAPEPGDSTTLVSLAGASVNRPKADTGSEKGEAKNANREAGSEK